MRGLPDSSGDRVGDKWDLIGVVSFNVGLTLNVSGTLCGLYCYPGAPGYSGGLLRPAWGYLTASGGCLCATPSLTTPKDILSPPPPVPKGTGCPAEGLEGREALLTCVGEQIV